MRIEISRGYRRDLRRIRDAELLDRIDDAIAKIEAASAVAEIPGVKSVRRPGGALYYRLRVGDYRLIFDPVGDDAVLVRFRHRKIAYRNLPR